MARTRGKATRVLQRKGCARDRLWFAIRALRRFDIPALMATAEAGRSNAQKYVIALTRAGYLRLTTPKANGRKCGYAGWTLIRDTGPLAPRLQRDGRTYDPNRHEIFEGGLRQ